MVFVSRTVPTLRSLSSTSNPRHHLLSPFTPRRSELSLVSMTSQNPNDRFTNHGHQSSPTAITTPSSNAGNRSHAIEDDDDLEHTLFLSLGTNLESYATDIFDHIPAEIGFDSFLSPSHRCKRNQDGASLSYTTPSLSESTPVENPMPVVGFTHEAVSIGSASSVSCANQDIRGCRKRHLEVGHLQISPIKRQRSRSPSDSNPVSNSSNQSEDGRPPRFRSYQTDQWMARYKELSQFKDTNGHCLVPHSFPANPNLTRWVKRQRYQYQLMNEGKRSSMTEDRLQALEALGFVWDSQEAQWMEKFNELLQYRNVHGHCDVPIKYEENRKLAVWVRFQRKQYKLRQESQPSSMTSGRIKQLEDVGFKW